MVIGLRQRQMWVALVGRVDVVAHVREAARCGDAPVRDGLDPAAVIPGVCPRRGHVDRDRSGWASSRKQWPYKAWSGSYVQSRPTAIFTACSLNSGV